MIKLTRNAATVSLQMTSSWFCFLIIGRELAVSGIRMVAASKRIVLSADRHGKIKFVFQVAAIGLTLLEGYPFRLWLSVPLDDLLMAVAAAVTVYSGILYVKKNYKRLDLHRL